jgi:AbrB family looped-hinge helix DNA binding protein
MNIGTYVQPTARGQVVIPVDYRKMYGIDENTLLNIFPYGDGIYIRPVTVLPARTNDDAAFIAFLKKNQGAWEPETPKDKKKSKTQRETELVESDKNRNAW